MGVAEIQKISSPTTVGDVTDMQLCVIKQGSPPVLGNVAFFCYRLTYISKMCSMHSGQIVVT